MNLKEILVGLDGIKAKGDIDLDITNVDSDSRNIKENGMFIAIHGFETDGNNYIPDAIKNGAKVIMVDNSTNLKELNLPQEITLLVVPDTRLALSICACNFYDNPSRKFKLIGVTGTKGKTTTTFMIKKILEKAGHKVGLIGTIAIYIGDKKIKDSSRTTPESIELQKIFADMVNENVDVVVMEVSSQSLKLNRVYGCDFDIGVFTNFSHEHISEKEHPDMEDYFESKLKLFDMCKVGYFNADDIYAAKAGKIAKTPEITTYGIDNFCHVLAKDITITNSYVDFKVKIDNKNERVKTCIPGRFSVYNSLAAICVATKLGANAEQIKEALVEVRVPGRSELVDNKRDLTIMIDYAHTPESLESILRAVKSYTKGRVISVFGCGGDRDKIKRPLMGEVSGRIATNTIITSDNPRTEDPEEIVKEIEVGIKKTTGQYTCIVDRREAIKAAIKMACKNDMIVLAGKGHEPYQEINHEKFPFDERIIVKEVIEELDEEADKKKKK
ncbi:MAG: UDP-N-acetylmuramoyl-L-alanyl-D-glutamate--2,6-diaminopimelate ligase [Clostridia bacterium]|nr:UDP-N-acetylmuramoyl-L-alanyl-D-glutamate--2,6-diaminopimelate ligase [Clostridia bacterium]